MSLPAPMLATGGGTPPADDGRWSLEVKWDGVRALVHAAAGGTRVESRRGNDIGPSYPELADLAAHLPDDTILDGEVVAFDPATGAPDFGLLQQRIHVGRPTTALLAHVPIVFLGFDVLRLAGHDTTALSYDDRRELLTSLELAGPGWHVPPTLAGAPRDVLAASAAQGLEGLVAKRRTSTYTPGLRSPDWLKLKNFPRQEVVVGGWEEGGGGRAGRLGALLVGVHEDGRLTYVGQVGTGFSEATLDQLHARLGPLQSATSPFDPPVPREHAAKARWLRPELVGDVAFAAWTREGRLRHPSWKGLRTDVDPASVRREPRG